MSNVVYIIAGKRFKAGGVKDLHEQLALYKLVTDLDNEGLGGWGARRISDNNGMHRYDMINTVGDSADVNGFDVCIGKLIGDTHKGEVVETDVFELEASLAEVRQEIPDAKILGGSYWI